MANYYTYLLEHKPNLNRRHGAMNFRGGSKVSFAREDGPIWIFQLTLLLFREV